MVSSLTYSRYLTVLISLLFSLPFIFFFRLSQSVSFLFSFFFIALFLLFFSLCFLAFLVCLYPFLPLFSYCSLSSVSLFCVCNVLMPMGALSRKNLCSKYTTQPQHATYNIHVYKIYQLSATLL